MQWLYGAETITKCPLKEGVCLQDVSVSGSASGVSK